MKTIIFSKRTSIVTEVAKDKSVIYINPGERLIFSDETAANISGDPNSKHYIHEISDINPLIASKKRPPSWRKKRILFYRNRGIGDQLIISSLSRFYNEMLGAEVFQLSERCHDPIFAYNPYISGNAALAIPMHLDAVWRAKGAPFFDGAFFFESVSEWDSDGEQENVYDRIFAMTGLDPADIPAKYKRPFMKLEPGDVDARNEWLKQLDSAYQTNLSRGYIVVQAKATNPGRCVPVEIYERVLYALNETASRRGMSILVSDESALNAEFHALIDKIPSALNISGLTQGVRSFASLIAGARLIVSPDSSGLHFAAAFDTPAIGLWGPFSPESRVKYYPHQIHLFHPEKCEHAPCFNYAGSLPTHKCPKGTAQTSCEVFQGITALEIENAVSELLK